MDYRVNGFLYMILRVRESIEQTGFFDPKLFRSCLKQCLYDECAHGFRS